MSKLLMVDDDPIIIEIYRKKLLQRGFEVHSAPDGLVASRLLKTERPDLVILDLMMPRFNGFEVLKFIRAEPDLKDIRVIVFSNLYLNDADRRRVAAAADLTLLKSSCTPGLLIETIDRVLAGTVPAPPAAANVMTPALETDTEAQERTRADFLKNAPTTLATLRQLNDSFAQSNTAQNQSLRLLEFYQKVHFLTALAGVAAYPQPALLLSAFEALLFELHQKPAFITPSTLQTIAYTLEFLRLLFAAASRQQLPPLTQAKALIVDDDPVSCRALAAALQRAQLAVASTQDPTNALALAANDTFDLFLLDIQMPAVDGFELCGQLRAQPRYQKTPIIFVTGHADFDNRLQSVLRGGNDLIAKPVFPIELAVKAVTHVLRSQLPEPWALA